MLRPIVMSLALGALACGQACASEFCTAQHVEAMDGFVRLARHWDRMLSEDMERDLSAWQVANYKDGIRIGLSTDQPHAGAACLLLTSSPTRKEKDTAWEIRSRAVPVTAGARVRLTFWRKNNFGLTATHGHGENYQSRLQWLDANGEGVGHVAVDFGGIAEEWRLCSAEAIAPEAATQMVIRLGFDSPNIGDGVCLALDDLELLVRSDESGYEPWGEFVSRPIRLKLDRERSLSWDSTTPPRTSVKFQVRGASDRDAGPGEWSAFSGPNGPASFFTRAGGKLPDELTSKPWLQYRAVLSTLAPEQTPIVEAVRFSSGSRLVADGPWSGVDETPPALASYAPTRTPDPSLPLRFTLADTGTGLDPRTVRLWLDSAEATPQRQGDGSYVYRPGQPLAPTVAIVGFQGWQCRNYRRRLLITRRPPRTDAGQESLHVTRLAGSVDTAFALMSPEISVQGGATYVLSYWMRTDMDLRRVDRRSKRGLLWRGAANTPIGEPVAIEYGPAAPAWREVRQEFRAPPQAEYAIVSLGWDSPNITDRHFVQFADVQLIGPHPTRADAPNLHRVRVAASDFAGNPMQHEWYILIKEPPKRGIVSVRDDGVTLVDGEPFFPIGIYSVSKRESNGHSFDQALAELRAAGFNTAHTYMAGRNADFRELYQMAVKHGMKLYVAPETGTNSPDAFAALATVVRECNEPALLAWYLGDDTASWIGPDELRRVHQAVRDADPYHITTQADGCSRENDDRYARFVNSTTGFLPELYPIRKKAGNHVADVIRGMKNIQAAWASAGRVTPVWAIIQDFEGWGWKRYPTDEEERCMVYLAIIHGAQGITWYTYAYRDDKHGAPWDPHVWAFLKSIAGELASLSEVLTSRDPEQVQKVEVVDGPALGDLGYPSINTRLKKHNGAHYLLAANCAPERVVARIAAPGLGNAAEVLFENRTVRVEHGQVQDTFEALAVHVYKW